MEERKFITEMGHVLPIGIIMDAITLKNRL